jgi:NitT/TauT family transport system permease protein
MGALRFALPIGAAATGLAVWHLAAALVARPYLLPAPQSVAAAAMRHAPRIGYHATATVAETLLGFALGFAFAALAGYALSRSRTAERLVMPYLVATQAVPVVAVAPLLVYWFGAGMAVKVATAAVIVFFPMLVNTVVGLRHIDPAYRELMRALSADRWQTLRLMEIPAALPVLLGGVRVGITLSVIGAVVGEFLGSDRGLGALVQVAGGQFNDALLFAAILTLVALALGLYALAALAERVLLRGRSLGDAGP